MGEMGWWLATAAPDEGATMGWSIAGVSKVIGGVFRGSIIGHGIRSMDATAREEKVVGLSVFTRKRCCRGRRRDQSAVGKMEMEGRKATGGGRVCLKRKRPPQDKRMAKADGEWRMG